MNAICAAGARRAAERGATMPAPLRAGAWKGSRRYIICVGQGGPWAVRVDVRWVISA